MALENVRKAGLLKEELDHLRPLDKEQEARIMQKFRLDWNYHSNHLEGNSLTFGETKALILYGITADGKPMKDHIEITGHDEAIKWIDDVLKENIPLTEKFIRELHMLLLKESHEKKAITPEGKPTKRMIAVGEYKTSPNHVKTQMGEIFYFATPEETPAKMHDLLNWYREQKELKDLNPVLLAAEFHYKFIRIHPFDDGNGRTARILMNFILMQFGYPPVIIKTEDKANYFIALQQADAGILEPFIEYIAKNLVRSLEIMLTGAKGGNIDEDDDIDKEIFLLNNKLNSIDKGKIVKNKNAIGKIYDNSISPLLIEFVTSCKKLDNFYITSQWNLFIDGNGRGEDLISVMAYSRDRIKDETKTIHLQYKYKTFKQVGFGEFDFINLISFNFKLNSYEVTVGVTSKFMYSRSYDESLNSDEIKTIVKEQILNHTKYIEEKIQQHKK